jgi:hypothetical protein
VYAGGLENARAQEDALGLIVAIRQDFGPIFSRFAPPDQF